MIFETGRLMAKVDKAAPPLKLEKAATIPVDQVDIGKCQIALSRLVRGDFRMCVPAHKDDDDVILSDVLAELLKYRERYGPL